MACLTPFNGHSKTTGEPISFPCGKCPECLTRRASGWSFRLLKEDAVASSSQFITLTYDTATVPINPSGYMSLRKRDVQLFLKRLRKAEAASSSLNPRIKYYAVGEYGEKSFRPHYHLILFNASIELVQPAWQLGTVHYGTVTGASVGYTLKYMCKPSRIPLHRNDDRLREFALMSKGLGESYLSDQMVRWHHADPLNRMYCNLEDGKKIAMPRYFKNKIYVESERKRIGFFARQKMAVDLLKKMALHGPTYDRDKIQSDLHAFNRMHYNSTLNRKTV